MFGKEKIMSENPWGSSSSASSSNRPVSLVDNHGRPITYLRLAITDRCNLRCRYCRPENGVPFVPHEEILTLEELQRIASIFSSLGINKIRVTGGEPFSRRGAVPFLKRLKQIEGVDHLYITTNGVKTSRYLDELAELGLDGINLSLDTLDPQRFWRITRRDYFDPVLVTLHGVLARQIPLKVNSVVLEDTSDEEILRLASLAEKYPLTLRFIERMPFSGTCGAGSLENGNMLHRLLRLFPALAEEENDLPTTARVFTVPGFTGRLGIIAGYSRLFCATCNKVRITPTGMLKTCLYDNGALNLKGILRSGVTDNVIRTAIVTTIGSRFANGHEAERSCSRTTEPSMAGIGG